MGVPFSVTAPRSTAYRVSSRASAAESRWYPYGTAAAGSASAAGRGTRPASHSHAETKQSRSNRPLGRCLSHHSVSGKPPARRAGSNGR
ncbi:hypothetical protein SVIOM342S_05502 [Streptomyces violaceorubidus]